MAFCGDVAATSPREREVSCEFPRLPGTFLEARARAGCWCDHMAFRSMPDLGCQRISRCFSATRGAVRRPHHIPDPIPFGPLAVGGAHYQLQPDDEFVGPI